MTRIDENLASGPPPTGTAGDAAVDEGAVDRSAVAERAQRLMDLERMLDSVRALHCRDAAGWCVGCGYQWPCATIRTVRPDYVRR